MIEASHLTKSFGAHKVVDDVSFRVDSGELVALLGPSGGGKSTVLRMLAGLEIPDEGKVVIREHDATNAKAQERGLGFVFQHYALFRHMTVRENIAFGLEVRKKPKAEVARRVDELIGLVQLTGLGDRYPHQLSGGQRQRVALARSLAPEPSIVLLDEPFGALDAKVRIELRGWLRRLQKEQGLTAIFVTHDQEEAMELADRVVIIHRGKVEQIGSPEEVYDHPATPFVASFIGSANVLTGTVARGQAALGSIAVPAPKDAVEGADVRAFVRHHQITIGASDASEAGVTRAKVKRITRVGWVAKLELDVDGSTLFAELPKARIDELGIREGELVAVSLEDATIFAEDFAI
ncbi:MAG TPA: TOBE-like domain-containing protein [Polyangiaceae bacterium]|nr:TOBE-like domain-containing protein [Polyangiaceae bacterium]